MAEARVTIVKIAACAVVAIMAILIVSVALCSCSAGLGGDDNAKDLCEKESSEPVLRYWLSCAAIVAVVSVFVGIVVF